jgi:succinoglycan biosynthesis protein ExoM
VTSVDVCVCTYRRDSLMNTLASIAHQDLEGTTVVVTVADNDDHDERRAEIESAGQRLGLDLQYVHAPARNISIARNACLEAAKGDWIAFIDDDEIATPSWLAQLMMLGSRHDIVFGLVQAQYPPDAPRWLVEGDFHSTGMSGNDQSWNGHTGNVLIKAAFVRRHRLKFPISYGQTGGEDTLFFFKAMKAGASFGYAPSAIVQELTERSRISFRWLLVRRFRSGQTHHVILRCQGRSVRGTVLALAKLIWSLAAAAGSSFRPPHAARHLLRSGLHAGVIASAIGIATYREYQP